MFIWLQHMIANTFMQWNERIDFLFFKMKTNIVIYMHETRPSTEEIANDALARSFYEIALHQRQNLPEYPVVYLVEHKDQTQLTQYLNLETVSLPALIMMHGKTQSIAAYEGPVPIRKFTPELLHTWTQREVFLFDLDEFDFKVRSLEVELLEENVENAEEKKNQLEEFQ